MTTETEPATTTEPDTITSMRDHIGDAKVLRADIESANPTHDHAQQQLRNAAAAVKAAIEHIENAIEWESKGGDGEVVAE